MQYLIKFLIGIFLIAPFYYVHAQVQCAQDVSILEGDQVAFCGPVGNVLNASSGFILYSWSGGQSGIGQSISAPVSGQYIMTAVDAIGCTSKDTIQVTVHSLPTDDIISSQGNPFCPTAGTTTLSLTSSYETYTWSSGSTSPTLTVNQPGNYAVAVMDANGCSATFSIDLKHIIFSISAYSGSICPGDRDTVTASGGTSYLWSTGNSGPSIIVSPTTTSTYSAIVTKGSCTYTVSQEVFVHPQASYSLPDTMYLQYGSVVVITGPQNYSNFLWLPNNHINNNHIRIINYEAIESQTLHVEMTSPYGCVVHDQIVIVVVQLDIPNGFSPNSDNSNDFFIIKELAAQYDGSFKVWNRWGEIVLDEENYGNDWGGTCEGPFCFGKGDLPEGTYFYEVIVHGISFKGYITLIR